MDELQLIFKNMRIDENKKNKNKNNIIKIIEKEKDLTNKCIYFRKYLSPQSTDIEKIIKKDLLIKNPINKNSGDGIKNGINYEIKYSGHSKLSKLNFNQIRPDHNIDYYILIYYNMYYNSIKGKGFCFKVPADNLYELIIKYGCYSHGTCKKLGKINHDNIKGKNYEYSLRCNPNSNIKNNKNNKLWNELLKYEIEYIENNF